MQPFKSRGGVFSGSRSIQGLHARPSLFQSVTKADVCGVMFDQKILEGKVVWERFEWREWEGRNKGGGGRKCRVACVADMSCV